MENHKKNEIFMVQIVNSKSFDGMPLKDIMEATYGASGNFQIRAFYEAKDEILNLGKFNEVEFFEILDAMINAETERKIVLKRLTGLEPLFLK